MSSEDALMGDGAHAGGKRHRGSAATRDSVVERLAMKGFALVGEYLGTLRSHCTIRCSKGHEWSANLGNVLKTNGTGCPHCAGKAKLTLESVKDRLSPRGIKMVKGTPHSNSRVEFECSKGHNWTAKLATVLNGCGCPECRPNRPLTRDEINSRVADRGHRLCGEYSCAGVKAEFECSMGHKWMATPDNILRGKGCPECADYGFNPKYPTFFYLIHIVNREERDFVGFGITRDIDTRYSYHARAITRKGYNHRLLDLIIYNSGHDAKALEDLVKENFSIVNTGIPGFKKEAIDGDDYPALVEMMRTLATCV